MSGVNLRRCDWFIFAARIPYDQLVTSDTDEQDISVPDLKDDPCFPRVRQMVLLVMIPSPHLQSKVRTAYDYGKG